MHSISVVAIALLLSINSSALLVWAATLLPNVMALGAFRRGGNEAESGVSFWLWGFLFYPLPYLLLTLPAVFFLANGNIIVPLLCSLVLSAYLLPFIIIFTAVILA